VEEVTLLRLLLRVVVVTSVIGVACSAPTTSLPGGNDAANDDEVNGKTDKAAPAPTSGAPAALPGDDDDDDDDSDAGAGDDDDDDDDDDD
jgi:hypothetical protein